MNNPEDVNNKQIIAMLENMHLLRRLFIQRSTSDSPLHFGQVAIMKTIESNENCTQNTIAQHLGVTAASVATSTKRLQKAGLITKTVDENNLRCKRLALTEKGREIISRHHEIFSKYDNLIFRSFSENEKLQLFNYLSRIVEEMKKVEGIDEQFTHPDELTLLLYRSMDNLNSDSDKPSDH